MSKPQESISCISSEVREQAPPFLETEIPTLPAIAQQLIKLCKDKHSDYSQFASVILSDQGLCSRILKVANSAFYGLKNKVSTVERAISVLGLQYVKSLALGFNLAKTFVTSTETSFDIQLFWQQCITRAAIARQLAIRCCPEFREEAFLIGLLEDCSIPILVEFYGENCAGIWGNYRTSPASLYRLENHVFDINHVCAAEFIMRKWNLPQCLVDPISHHHNCHIFEQSSSSEIRLCQIAYCVGNLSLEHPDSFCDQDLHLLNYMEVGLGVGIDIINDVLQQASEESGSIIHLFSGILPENINIIHLLMEAKNMLGRLHDESQTQLFSYEGEMEKLRQANTELVKNQKNKSSISMDELTGVATRGGILDYIKEHIDLVRLSKKTLIIFFFDVDDLKSVNDKYGHVAGDGFLKDYAAILRGMLENNGCVGRYGGDEFVVAMTGLKLTQAIQWTKDVTQKLCSRHPDLNYRNESEIRTFSSSVGMVFCEAGSSIENVTQLIELADNMMYKMKKTKQKRMCWRIIKSAVAKP